MNGIKTAAERLREAEALCSGHGMCRVVLHAINGETDCPPIESCTECKKGILNTLASQIEAEQAANPSKSTGLPEGVIWPTYEGGELVKPFDKLPGFDSGGVQKFIWTSSHNGAWQLQDAEGHMLNVMHGEFVKRPEPEVLDADGVPIKGGDTVYAPCAEPLTVRELISEALTLIEDSNGNLWELRNDALTHRKPDTQEDIDADAALSFAEYTRKWPCPIDRADDSAAWHREHLLARQRKLLGGE